MQWIMTPLLLTLASAPVQPIPGGGASEAHSQAQAYEILSRAGLVHGEIRSLAGLGITFRGSLFPRSQSPSPDPPFRPFPFEETIVFGEDPQRQVIDESLSWPNFVARYRIVVDRERSFDVDLGSGRVLSPHAPPSERRIQSVLRVPSILLRLALANAASLRYVDAVGSGEDRRDIVSADVWGNRLTLWLDGRSRLRRIARMRHQPMSGDTEEILELSGEQRLAQILLPETISLRHGGNLSAELRVALVEVVPGVENRFRPPAGPGAPPPDAAGPPEITRLDDGVWLVRGIGGGDYASLVVEADDGLTVVETPGNSRAMAEVVTLLASRFPSKKITRAILTHHHFDHSGGVRAVMAEGATILVSPGNVPFFRSVGSAPHTIQPDALRRAESRWKVEALSDRTTLSGRAGPTLEAHLLGPTAHADESVFVWLPREKILFQGDLFSKRDGDVEPARPQAIVLLERIELLGLDVRRIVGVHGAIATLEDLEAAVRLARSTAR